MKESLDQERPLKDGPRLPSDRNSEGESTDALEQTLDSDSDSSSDSEALKVSFGTLAQVLIFRRPFSGGRFEGIDCFLVYFWSFLALFDVFLSL